MPKSRNDQEKESHLGQKETNHAEEEDDYHPAETGSTPPYAVAAKEAHTHQATVDRLEQDERKETPTPTDQTQQAVVDHQTKENHPY